MAFSEDQLQTWSNQGATVLSRDTYNSIQTCINGINWNDDVRYNIYLQGSYRNSTNIRGNSDVDVVIEFSSTFISNKYDLPTDQLRAHNEYYSSAKYKLDDYKQTVINQLQDYYGAENIEVGNKAIKVVGNDNRLNADVICGLLYKKYNSFSRTNRDDYIPGLQIITQAGRSIISYPKVHYQNGTDKNADTNNNYKPTIRIIKNMATRLIENGTIADDVTSSYYIECLLYNIPNERYRLKNYQNIIVSILSYLHENREAGFINDFVSQDEQMYLFGDTDQQWNRRYFNAFLSSLIQFWND